MEILPINMNESALAATDLPLQAVQGEDRKLIQAIKALNATELFGQNNELTFVLDRRTHRPLLRIIDRETGEVIRQIPSEHALRLAEEL